MKPWKGSRLSVREIINHIPDDGCVLVFNAPHLQFRQRCVESGVLSCRVADGLGNAAPIRDLYITWKEKL